MTIYHLTIFAPRKTICMKKILLALGIFSLLAFKSFGQDGDCAGVISGQDCLESNAITTAVPFLLIAPDTRSAAMGDAGVALSPDANAQHWNASKLAFSEDEMGVSLSYSPWLRQLVDDMSLSYLSWFMKLNNSSAIGASLRYFTLGDIIFTDNNGNTIRPFRPNEFAVDVSYSFKLSERFSGGITARWINSNLTGGVNVGGADSRAANAFAVDLSGYYVNDDMSLGDKDAELAFGFNISNIGNKVSYTNTAQRDFLPINLRLGAAYTIELDQFNSLTFIYDANKLLVPTPPIYDSPGDPGYTGDPNFIIAGKDPDVGVAAGMFGSFADAPGVPIRDDNGVIQRNPDNTAQIESGSVFREELREINHSFGLEYWYDNQLAVRGGYFHEHPTKGNRQYFSMGIGARWKMLGLDISYLIPTEQRNPLANTLRFGLSLDFGYSASQDSPNEN